MKINTGIFKSVGTAFCKAGFRVKKHSPEILVGVGVIGTVASSVLACKATTKLSGILEETKTQTDQIHEVVESGQFDEEVYSKADAGKDLAIIYTNTAVKLFKLYAPSVLLGAASIGCILKGHSILRGRNIALAAAYTALDKGFKEYRGNVVERFGETVDRELRHNLKAQKITEIEVDPETGEEKKVKKTVSVMSGQPSIYAKFFDEACPAWEKDPEKNKYFLLCQQNYANELLKSREGDPVLLNEVYDMIGLPRTKAGTSVGWVYDEKNPLGDNFIDFGIFDIHRETARDFVNGYERSILLDFNVDGYVADRFKEDESILDRIIKK